MIPESFIQELLTRVDIVELIGRTVQLKKTGKNFMACCPFHKEKTPSFSVSPQKQLYKCFGCGAGGSAIQFVMQLEGVNYPEAIRRLAGMVGMTVPEDPFAAKRAARAHTLTDRMDMATAFYRKSLPSAAHAVAYLKKRGITGETAARYALGFSPEGWQSLEAVFKEHYKDKELEETEGCGLVIVNEEGRRYDRFRGRLMFPIRNPRGQVIGFGARTLNGDEHPKYLNSPETAIYHKGREIYGLYEASESIRKKSRAIVCEGYMDVIQLAQAGFTESVAALGTAITSDHVKKLLKIVDCVYFCFDGDGAGQHALRRALEAALPVVGDKQDVRFIVLPVEHDPDSLVKEKGPSAFEEAIAGSLSLSEYFVKAVSEGKDLATPEGRSAFLADAKPLVVGMVSAPFLRAQLMSELAMRSHMSPDDLEVAFGLAKPRPAAAPKPQWKKTGKFGVRGERPISHGPTPVVSPLQERVLRGILCYPALCAEFDSQIEAEFVGSESGIGHEIVEVWRAALSGDSPVETPQILLEMLASSPDIGHYRALLDAEMEVQTSVEEARFELRIAFLQFESQRVVARLDNETAAGAPDLALMQSLYARKKMLDNEIAQLRKDFAQVQTALENV